MGNTFKISDSYRYCWTIVLISLLVSQKVNAQQNELNIQKILSDRYQAITTVMPFLSIVPDARAAGMGDVGVAVPTDAFSPLWNAAKLPYMAKGRDIHLGASYTPWLSNIADGIYLFALSGYKKLSQRSAAGFSARYFAMGQLDFTERTASGDIQPYKTVNPAEFSVAGYYGLKINKLFSLGAGLRFLYSDITNGAEVNGINTKAGMSVGLDISAFYSSPVIKIQKFPSIITAGANITNIGPKVTYSDEQGANNFLPTTLKIGGAIRTKIGSQNEVILGLDLSKLLVPTPPEYAFADNGTIKRDADGLPVIRNGYDPNVNVIQGVLQSFYDAPGGFTEELKEFTIGIGAEYILLNMFAARAGYQMGNIDKGNRSYLTFGLGLDLRKYALDLSYLVPTGDSQSPLENTLRVSFQYDVFGFIRAISFGGRGRRSSRR